MRHLTTLKLIDAVTRFGSIRRAAEEISLTPSALHRRIQSFEEEIGGEIFERLPGGVRLNAAGELVVDHIRRQIAETERLKSRLADLAGMRRGHISIACSQALTTSLLPNAIAAYRKSHPDVTFEVMVADHLAAEQALIAYEVDLALVFDSHQLPEFEVMLAVHQDLRAVMARTHPLARENELRLRQCLDYPLALPTKAFGGRQLLEESVARTSMELHPHIESTSFDFLKAYVLREPAITFQIPVGTPEDDLYEGLVSKSIAPRDIRDGFLYLGQRRGRALSVASSRFADQLTRDLANSFQVV
ncbi:MAG: LysR substrate-binding domain-containing protein [Pseudomonadota bacterium]